jgi:hypothetical protein
MTDIFLSGFAFGVSFLSLSLLLRMHHVQRRPGVTVTAIEEAPHDPRL